MKSLFIAALASGLALCAANADAASTPLKRGIWASASAGCQALAKAERKKRLPNDEVLDGAVEGTTAYFMIVDRKSLGWPDAECKIGKARKSGRFTVRPLSCQNSEGGKATDTLRSITPRKIRFMSDNAVYHFCRP